MTLVLMVISFVTADTHHQTRFGNLGEDFAGFYYAGTILNGPTPEKLYDPATQDEAYYEIFPTLRPIDEDHPGKNLPYVHPPIVAFLFRSLAGLSYPTAYAVWLGISACLYGAGLAVTWRLVPSIPIGERAIAFLLALAFEPFLMECWLGGQLSGFAFLCLALAFYWEEAGKLVLSGLILGLCLYKPTLVILLLPMLVIARRWWTLLGIFLTGLGLVLASVLAVGPEICFRYVDALRGFTSTATGSGMDRKDFKFIDLNFFFRNLFGGPTLAGKVLVVAIAAVVLFFLFFSWRKVDRWGQPGRRLIWASTVTWTMVINVYMGIYDLVLVVLSILWTADVFYRPQNRVEENLPTFKVLVFLVIGLAWVTQKPVASLTGFQIITPALFALAAFQLRLAWKAKEDTPVALPDSSALSQS